MIVQANNLKIDN